MKKCYLAYRSENLKILMVSLNAFEMNTSAMIRNKALINGLLENNVEVDFLTIPALKNNSYYDNSNFLNGKINIIRLNANKNYINLVNRREGLKGIIKKYLLNISRKFYHSISIFDNTIFIVKKIKEFVNTKVYYDIIISSSDPKSSHVATNKLIELGLKYGKWIQYWGDPLVSDIAKKTILPKWYVKKLEAKLFYDSDVIVYVSPFTLEEQKKIHVKFSGKMIFLPIPYYKKKYYDLVFKNKDTLKLGYFGDYNSKIRNIMPLYNYCKMKKINLLIAGNTNLELESDEKVKIYQRVEKVQLDKLEFECDILVCILNKSGTQIPGKIYHYAATNKPILIILDGDKKDLIKDYLLSFNRFIFTENDENKIDIAIDDILNKNESFEPSPQFDSRHIAKKILNI